MQIKSLTYIPNARTVFTSQLKSIKSNSLRDAATDETTTSITTYAIYGVVGLVGLYLIFGILIPEFTGKK
ncbi:MAG: hypothetical protein M0P71_07605 [Melioribacteraceae bacterium]|jgi:hypothetical protein|nr:hypothetical protein [Melioribacteraceae bacterium]MDD3982775.1 hypothetical protein [Candidatus Omnitrophota bacterium]